MSQVYKPWPYQAYTTQRIIESDQLLLSDGRSAVGPFLDMGLGKTVSTLTAIDELIYERKDVKKVLVVAPKLVVEETWPKEVKKWAHLSRLRVSVVSGDERARNKALEAKADIYLVSRDNVVWLVGRYSVKPPFDMLVVDELSSFKSPKSKRFKALRSWVVHFKRVVGLTGTPRSNGLIDIWSQIYLLDRGERLGSTVTGYRERYFRPGKRQGHIVYSYDLKKGDPLLGADIYERQIYDKIGDICFSMKAKDYLDVPPLLEQDVVIEMPQPLLQEYLKFEKDQILAATDERGEIAAFNAAALTGKLQQFASGAIYDENKVWHEVHRCKIEALREDIEAANGQPFLLFYHYQHSLERILQSLQEFNPVKLEGAKQIEAWNSGKIQLLLAHPASTGHGLNLQHGGHYMGWFDLTWSLELYLQAVARLHRQGQSLPVINRRYIMAGTIDTDIADSLKNKNSSQEAMLAAIKARISRYLTG
jgi:SNF2 family DNA or RNA helicase